MRGDLRVERIETQNLLGDERVARAVGGVEAHLIGGEAADQCVHLVRVADVEGRVTGQTLDFGQCRRQS